MQRKYTTTFLDFTPNDIDNFVTIRRRFDNPLQYRLSRNKITDLILSHEQEQKVQEETYRYLINEEKIIEKEIQEFEQIKFENKQIETKFISFPYQSFLNLRYWRKSPKSLKIFFQALACFLSISNSNLLTTLKMNHHHLIHNLKFYQPSSTIIDEFRMKYLNLKEISLEYIRNKSLDAYMIAIWMYNIEHNERLNRIKQIENKLNELHIKYFNKHKEIQLIEHKIQTLKKNSRSNII